MERTYKLKVVNDPIYGFIAIPNSLIFQLLEHPFMQRLRRITQMGLSYLVFPGAHHTRFQHALGAMFLMQKAVQVLRAKQVTISAEEEEALYVAILLHDVGHGPFSHALEQSLVSDINHETLSSLIMASLNDVLDGRLDLAISIFENTYHRKFMHQLVSGQLDMDRLDYLRRDSFYTGVPEGNVNSQRLITMLNVKKDKLVVESKGIYSVEKFILARRLMYWSVYLHKTSLVAEQLLLRLLKRAKVLGRNGVALPASPALAFFLNREVGGEDFSAKALEYFVQLDDYDIISALKQWCDAEDYIIRKLSQMILNRDLLRIKMREKPFSATKMTDRLKEVAQKHNLSEDEASYFVFSGSVSNRAYGGTSDAIYMLNKNGSLTDVVKASDQLNLQALSTEVVKYYMCYPKKD